MNTWLNQKIADCANALRALGVGQSAASCLRIALWIALFYGAISWVAAPAPHTAPAAQGSGQVTRYGMEGAFGDPRGFLEPPAPAAATARIAWISDSSSQFRDPGGGYADYLPDAVLDGLADGNAACRYEVLAYVLNAQRLYDSYICLLDALKHRPSAVVMSLNPVWSFERRSLLFRRHLMRTAGQCLTARPRDVAWYAALAEPSAWADAALAPLLPALRDRHDWHARLQRIAGKDRQAAAAPAPLADAAPGAAAGTRYPAVFIHGAYDRYGRDGQGFLSRPRYAAQQAQVEGTGNEALLRLILDTARAAQVPLLLYLSPLDPAFLQDPAFAAKHLREIALLESLREETAGGNTVIVPLVPEAAAAPLQFLDYIHLYQGPQNDPYTRFLSNALREVLPCP